jgi:predicted flavoprotein YhiN
LKRFMAPGWRLRFATPEGEALQEADAVLLALGGASWPRLGSDGGWAALLPDVALVPFAPANMGVRLDWSERLVAQHAGAPLKRIAITFAGTTIRGEAVLTASGLEGGAIYALSAPMREAIARDGEARLTLDLRPELPAEEVRRRLAQRGRGETVSTALRKALGLPPATCCRPASPPASRQRRVRWTGWDRATRRERGATDHTGTTPCGLSAVSTKELRVSFTPGMRSSAFSANSA